MQGCLFIDCNMKEMDLSGQDFSKVEFMDVDFTRSNLSQCKMGKICNLNLKDCIVIGLSGLPIIFSMLNYFQQEWFRPQFKGKKVLLLHKASRDGFTAKAFHSKCDGKSPTITFIKSEHGYIFGGYTQAQWSRNGEYTYDENAFIFTFKDGNELFKVRNPSNAIYNHHSNYVAFSAFGLCDGCKTNKSSISYFNETYELPSNITSCNSELNM